MSEQDYKRIQSLRKKGMISDTYATFLSQDTEAANIAATALLGSVQLQEYALETGIPLIVAEAGVLYEVNAAGDKKFLEQLPQPTKKYPKRFKLK